MTGIKRRMYPEVNPRTATKAVLESPRNHAPGSTLPRTNLSAERVMRFCYPEGAKPVIKVFDASGVENWTPLEMLNTNMLPLFGDLTLYGATLERQKALWDVEINRLLLENEGAPKDTLQPNLRPNRQSQLQSPIQPAQLCRLQTAADQLLHSLHVCVLDDQRLLNDAFDDCGKSKGARSYRELKRAVRLRIDLPGRYEETNHPGYVGNSDLDKNSRQIVSVKPIAESELEDYYYLVDQITATMARSAILASDSQYLHVVILACLAKLSTKLKFLAVKLDKHISQCLKKNMLFNFAEGRLGSEAEDDNVLGELTDSSPEGHRYCTEFDVVTTWLVDSLTRVLQGLGARKPWGVPSDHLDLCTIIYQAGVPGNQTLLHQSRGGSISGSSTAISLEYSSTALKIVRELGTTCLPTSSTSSNDIAATTTLTFESVETAEGKPQSVYHNWRLQTIIDLVIVCIPLSLSCPTIGCGFERSLRTISALSAFGKTKPPASNKTLSVFVSLVSHRKSSVAPHTEYSSLSDSLLATIRHDTFQRKPLISSSSGYDINAVSANAQKKRQDLKQAIDEWAIQETSIVIGCATYVNSVLCLSLALVLGGLLCGFLVGERIPGVDPFNLTMFAWIIGGFVLLIAKSVMVSNWTWRDLLLRKVTCRSLGEVSSVTGLDPQDILIFLLFSERQMTLRTGGPYQQSFLFSPTADGFSIDVKPTLQTLLAAGIIPVMVSTLDGPVLLQLRLVGGSLRYSHFGGRGKIEMSPAYLEFPEFGVKGDAITTWRDTSWIQVLGLYNSTSTSFR